MLIAEELLLLSLDDVSGRHRLAASSLEPALGAALLTELVLRERLRVLGKDAGWTARGRVEIVSEVPTDDPLLDGLLGEVSRHPGRTVKQLISPVSGRRIGKVLPQALGERLVRAGILTEQREKALGLFPYTRWPARDLGPEQALLHRLQAVLVHGAEPTEREATLVALLRATNLLPKVVAAPSRSALNARAKQLSEGDWAAKAVKDVIDEVSVALTAAVVASGGGDGGSS